MISAMKNRQVTMIFIFMLPVVCQNIFSQGIVNSDINEEWREEIERIAEQAENWRSEQQSRILTLSDLEFTYWEVDEVGGLAEEISWNFAFLNQNHVLLLYSDTMLPYMLIQYSVRDNVIFFTKILRGYLDGTYLFIGDERRGYVKFKLQYVISGGTASGEEFQEWIGAIE
jgi:hypothetical protein